MKIQKITARDPSEDHRSATMLELFFDLVTVVAIAAAATGFHHMYAEGHILEAILKFTAIFVSIWWAWVNFTWYASAFDSDDTAHRIGTMIIMGGAMILAAGVPGYFENLSMFLPLAGYVIMRLGLAFLWWRAAIANGHEWRGTAIRYGLGLVVLQIMWVSAVLVFEPPILFGVLPLIMLGEFYLPTFAEAKKPTPWHRHHIVERYNLLNIIVLGESLLAVGIAIQAAYHGGHVNWPFVGLAASGLVIVCALWWLYFAENDKALQMSKKLTFVWAYGHIILFASGAAVGAGLAVMVEVLEHKAHISSQLGIASVAIPAALYLLGLWYIHPRFGAKQTLILPLAAASLFAIPFLSFGIYPVAGVLVIAVIAKSLVGRPTLQET